MKTYHFTNKAGNHLAVIITIRAINLSFALKKLTDLLGIPAYEWEVVE